MVGKSKAVPPDLDEGIEGFSKAGRLNQFQGDGRHSWLEAWRLCPGNVMYCWHATMFVGQLQHDLEQAKFITRNLIVWAKTHHPISRGHYHWRHELCWYAVRKGKGANWIGGRKQNTLWELGLDQDVIGGHSAQKPVELMARPIRNHEGDVYDCFIGTGSTMVAAQKLKRRCYGMDIDARYVAVTLERMAEMGLKPKRVEA